MKKLIPLVLLSILLIQSANAAEITGGVITDQSFESAKVAIEQKAKDVAKQIEIYIKAHPEKTLADLQNDEYFQEIAVQQVGETGYTAVTDYETLICRFHSNPAIVNTDLSTLSDTLPGFWEIMSKTKGGVEASGVYDWLEPDSSTEQKYMYISIVDAKTADNVGLHVAATTYLHEYSDYEKETEEKRTFSKEIIKDQANLIAKQVEIYLKSNPELTSQDLLEDEYFREIAVQPIGETGYTVLYNYETMINFMHFNPEYDNVDYNKLKEKSPDFWEIAKRTINAAETEADGFYDWLEPNGEFREKYMYLKVIPIRTADDIGLALATTTYIDEYEKESEEDPIKKSFTTTLINLEEIFNDLIKEDTNKIKTLMEEFMQSQEHKELFMKKDREALYQASIPLFEENKENDRVTHLYYHTLEDTVFLRVHNKDIYGDVPTRETFRMSKESNSWGTGIELGKTAFALRVVHPYNYNDEKIGYIEFGEEIDHFFPEMEQRLGTDVEIAVIVEKEYIDETKWASVRSEKNLRNNYHDLEGFVVIDSTDTSGFILADLESHKEDISLISLPEVFEIQQFSDKTYIQGGFPLYDASGTKVGAILVSQDVTKFYETEFTENFEKNAVKLRATQIARQIENYILNNPEKTTEQLQSDEAFHNIAVQPLGEDGYSVMLNRENLQFLLHQDPNMVGISLEDLKEKLPEAYNIASEAKTGEDSEGFYDWLEPDGQTRKKYTYITHINTKPADGTDLLIAATVYLDEFSQVEEKPGFNNAAKEAIRKRAFDIANQIENYLENNPEKTLQDLKEDSYFQTIAVQGVGKTGYTLVYDCNSMINHFHKKEKFLGMNYTAIKDEPGREKWWDITSKTWGCERDSEGTYSWKDPDGIFREKYKYTAIIQTKTADGIQLALAVSTYLDEYASPQDTKQQKELNWIYITIGIIGVLSYSFILSSIKHKENKKLAKITYGLIISGMFLLVSYVFNLNVTTPEYLLYSERLLYASGFSFIIFFTMTLTEIYKIKPRREITIASYILSSLITLSTLFTNLAITLDQQNSLANGPGFKYLIIAMIFPIIFSLFVSIKYQSRENKKFLLVSVILAILVLTNVVYYAIIDSSNPYLLLISPLALTAILSYSLFKVNFIEYNKNTTMILLGIALLVVIGLFIFGSLSSIEKLKEKEIETKLETNEKIIQKESSVITHEINHFLNSLEILAESLEDENPSSQSTSDHLEEAFKRTEHVSYATYRIDKDGIIVNMFPLDENSIGADISEQEHMKKISQNLEPVVSDSFNAVEGFTGITIHAPVISSGKYDGTVAYLINLNDFSELFLGESEIFDKLYLLDSNNIIVYESEREQIGEQIDLEELIEKPGQIKIEHEFEVGDKTWRFINLEREEIIIEKISDEINTQRALLFIIVLGTLIIGIVFNFLLTRSLRKEVASKTTELKEYVSELEKTRTATLNMMEDLKEVNEHLKDLDKAKSNFLNIVSHELKTPLTAMFAYLDILKDMNKNLTEDEKKSLDAIRRNSDQLKTIINNILEISRIEAGKFELINTQINPAEKINQTVENLKPLAERKGIKLISKPDKSTPKEITTDEQRFNEIFNNLISNAIKFTEKGSITITSKKDGDKVLFTVEDTGVGMPKEKMKNLFQKFYQVDASISRKYGGTGLGLSITKQLIELQGGKIWVESQEGKGTTFFFTLPIKQANKEEKKDA